MFLDLMAVFSIIIISAAVVLYIILSDKIEK